MKKPKRIPTFKTESGERKFWETHDSADYVDWSEAERARFRHQQTRCAVSVADQDVVGREGGIEKNVETYSLQAQPETRSSISFFLSKSCAHC